MNLNTRISLLLSLFLLIILALFNGLTYYFVINITTDSEIKTLWSKALTIIDKEELQESIYWNDPRLFEEYHIQHEIIRIIEPDSTVRYQDVSDEELLNKPPSFHPLPSSDIINTLDDLMIFVQVPIYDLSGLVIGTLEIGRNLVVLDKYLDTLVLVLLYLSVIAVLVSLLGGLFYTRVVFRPIGRLVTTMQAIRESGKFRKIPVVSKYRGDELTQLTVTFNSMINQLEKTFEKQKQFISDASHELRTPLMIIEGYANMLRRWADKDPKLRMEAIVAIHAETIRLKNLTSSLLTLGVVKDENISKSIQSLDLIPLISEITKTMKLTFERDLYLCLESESIRVNGDPETLRQLMIILLDNAIKYSEKAIRIILNQSSKDTKIKIQDLGIGIAKREIPHLFDRFYRADKSRNRDSGGTGLGLSIAKNIVSLHGGTIHIESDLGIGTCVTVTLPLKGRIEKPESHDK